MASLLLAGCTSLGFGPVDRGVINPNGVAEEELATLVIHQDLVIDTIDGEAPGWPLLMRGMREQTVKLPAGIHTFGVKYASQTAYTNFPQTVVAVLNAGSEYRLFPILLGRMVSMEILETETNRTVSLQPGDLRGSDEDPIRAYIKYVLDPTTQESGKTIKLENEDTIILFFPNMTYSIEDKASGVKTEGYKGFTMDISMENAKVFLLETDISAMTKDQFLNESNYEETAGTVLVPAKCDATSVTYRYLSPVDLADQEVTFSISVL